MHARTLGVTRHQMVLYRDDSQGRSSLVASTEQQGGPQLDLPSHSSAVRWGCRGRRR